MLEVYLFASFGEKARKIFLIGCFVVREADVTTKKKKFNTK